MNPGPETRGLRIIALPRHRERRAWRERIELVDREEVVSIRPRQGVERQPKSHGRVAGNQIQPLVAQKPSPRRPRSAAAAHPPNRQRVADDGVQTLREDAAQAIALHFVFEAGVEGVHVHRQLPFPPQVVPHVFVTRLHVGGGHAQLRGEGGDEALGVGRDVSVRMLFVGEEARVRPCGVTVRAPIASERPARQLLAGVPLALSQVNEAVRSVTLLQPKQQIGGARALGRPERGDVPFVGVAIGRRHERRLSAHRQAHVADGQVLVNRASAREDLFPLRVGVGLGDTRRFRDPLHRHLVDELDLAWLNATRDWRGSRWLGRACEWNVPFAREQSRRRIEADPAGAWQVHLAPGVEVGEVAVGACGSVQRLHVRDQLDQIAGHETRSEPEVAKHLHEQPRGVAARA